MNEIKSKGNGEAIWIRTTGRYSLAAQKEVPKIITSKWRKLIMSPKGGSVLLNAFDNNEALRWWRINGDGRDLSLRQFLQGFSL